VDEVASVLPPTSYLYLQVDLPQVSPSQREHLAFSYTYLLQSSHCDVNYMYLQEVHDVVAVDPCRLCRARRDVQR
jgi:hypothetical protein